MTEYLQYQTIIQFRVPINSKGEAGTPQTLKQFTTPMKGTSRVQKKKKVEPKKLTTTISKETIEY